MFLIGDESYRLDGFPWVTGLPLIIINVAFFVGQSFLGESVYQWLQPDTRRDHVGGRFRRHQIHQGKTQAERRGERTAESSILRWNRRHAVRDPGLME